MGEMTAPSPVGDPVGTPPGATPGVTRWEYLVKGEIPPADTPKGHPVGGPVGVLKAPPGMETKPVSTSLLITKMSIRHLSYISTDLFWTKISPANTKVAFLPLGAHFLLWEIPFYIQTHEFSPIQKICRTVTKKFFLVFSKSAQATNCLKRFTNWLEIWQAT